jgi:opacity protein-like surface antigen
MFNLDSFDMNNRLFLRYNQEKKSFLRLVITSIIIVLFFSQNSYSQYATTKIKDKFEAYTDSLKQVKYTNVFPIWGQKAYQKGFDIPYPTGVMVNYMYLKQGLIIDNLQLGLQTDNIDIPMTPVDLIKFGDNYTSAHTIMFRPDVWVFPFLNVYGIFGYGESTTEVNLTYPITFQSVVEQSVRTTGFGVTAAGGVGPVWIALDTNLTWNKPELVEEAVRVTTFGIRMGHNFVFKEKPYRNIGVWVGAMKVKMGSETTGQIKLSDVIPQSAFDRAAEIESNYYDWLNSLNPNNPIDAIKIEKANEILTPIVEQIGNANGDAVISYGIDKKAKQEWNGIIGAQFQYNKNWMLRTEAGVLGDRKSILVSLNYRFLL